MVVIIGPVALHIYACCMCHRRLFSQLLFIKFVKKKRQTDRSPEVDGMARLGLGSSGIAYHTVSDTGKTRFSPSVIFNQGRERNFKTTKTHWSNPWSRSNFEQGTRVVCASGHIIITNHKEGTQD